MKIIVRGYIYHKEAEQFSACVDRYGYNLETNKFAISDGVTSSFASGIWAELLISSFIETFNKIDLTNTQHINEIQNIWYEKVSKIAATSTKWVFKTNFVNRRAGLATFVGLHFYNDNDNWIWEASALGDSFLFFVPETLKKISFGENENSVKYLSSKNDFEFDNYPDCFASQGNFMGEVQTKSGVLGSGHFLLMTDALSEWFIKEKEKAFETIKSWNSHFDFINSIHKLRSENRLHNDDSAILILNIKNDGLRTINYQLTDIDNISELTDKQKYETKEVETKEVETKEVETKEVETKEVETISQSEIVSTPKDEGEIKGINSTEKKEFSKNDSSEEINDNPFIETFTEETNSEKSPKIFVIDEIIYSNSKKTGTPEEVVLKKISRVVKKAKNSIASFLHFGHKKNDSENKEFAEEKKSEVVPITVEIVEMNNNDPEEIEKVIEEIQNKQKQKPKTKGGKASNTIINKF